MLSDGKQYEVKKLVGNQVYFSRKQCSELSDNVKIIIDNGYSIAIVNMKFIRKMIEIDEYVYFDKLQKDVRVKVDSKYVPLRDFSFCGGTTRTKFLNIMKKHKIIDPDQLLMCLIKIAKEHPELIEGYNYKSFKGRLF